MSDHPNPSRSELQQLKLLFEEEVSVAWRGLILWLVIGGGAALISIGSYASASEQAERSGSASYVILWGPAAFGGYKILFQHLPNLLRAMKMQNQAAASLLDPNAVAVPPLRSRLVAPHVSSKLNPTLPRLVLEINEWSREDKLSLRTHLNARNVRHEFDGTGDLVVHEADEAALDAILNEMDQEDETISPSPRQAIEHASATRCSSCGGEVSRSATFCGSCGEWLRHDCPACGIEVNATARFCPQCGEAVAEA
jgi:predicted RNA-binding Zn-ribbon protein involved in translation (DUF1610 family)